MYAVATVGLSLVWAAIGMLNMAHGAFLMIGGYLGYSLVTQLGLGLLPAVGLLLAAGALLGLASYLLLVRPIRKEPGFETTVIIASAGLAVVIENLVLGIFGAYPLPQPIMASEAIRLFGATLPLQNLLIIGASLLLLVAIALLLRRTALGRAICATVQDRDAAQLMGVAVGWVDAQVMALAGVLAVASGVMLSSVTTLSPSMGFDPLLKAFIMCVVAGLGNVPGSIVAAFALGLFETAVQYWFGTRWGFPSLLLLVIVVLIWRPTGLFGRRQVTRL